MVRCLSVMGAFEMGKAGVFYCGNVWTFQLEHVLSLICDMLQILMTVRVSRVNMVGSVKMGSISTLAGVLPGITAHIAR